MTNPNNIVGTNAGYNGRTTPNAFNAVMQLFDASGVLSGWNCRPKSGMVIQIGGVAGTQDVAIAEDNGGNRTAIVNRTATPVEITISGAPATNNRYDTIVAYVNNPQQGTGASDVDFPSQTGIIAVKGTVAANPAKPTEAQIKTAITADGGNGNTAYYVHLADIYVAQGVTSITAGNITQGTKASIADIMGQIVAAQIADGAISTAKLASSAVTTAKVANSAITDVKIDWDTIHSGTPVALGFTASGGTYTAPHFGYIVIECAVQNNAKITASINGNETITAQGGSAAFEWIPITIPVGKGDVIVAASSDGGNNAQVMAGSSKFIPLS